jgi:hypothetical protein
MHEFPLPAWYAALQQDRNSLNHFEALPPFWCSSEHSQLLAAHQPKVENRVQVPEINHLSRSRLHQKGGRAHLSLKITNHDFPFRA